MNVMQVASVHNFLTKQATMLQQFADTGVFVSFMPDRNEINYTYEKYMVETVRLFAKDFASKHGMKWNSARVFQNSILLMIHNSIKLRTVHTPLRIMAGNNDSYASPCAKVKDSTQYTYYNFHGVDGVKIFNEWLHRCRTDRVFRVALNLP